MFSSHYGISTIQVRHKSKMFAYEIQPISEAYSTSGPARCAINNDGLCGTVRRLTEPGW